MQKSSIHAAAEVLTEIALRPDLAAALTGDELQIRAEYDQLQGKDKTALMQNYEFLKQTGKTDDEIFDLLLSKDTDSDRRRQIQEDTLSLFNALSKRDLANTDPNVLYEQAQRMALVSQGLIAPAADSKVVETVDLD